MSLSPLSVVRCPLRRSSISDLRTLVLVLLILFVVSNVNAQDPAPSPTTTPEPIRTCVPKIDLSNPLISEEQMLDELKCWRTVGPLLQDQLRQKDEQIKTTQELAAERKASSDFWKEASQNRAGANSLEAERDRLHRERREEDRAEITHLRTENDKLRASRDKRAIWGFVGGIGVCYANRIKF